MNRDEKGESKRRPAAAGGRRRQGRQQRTGEEKAARAGEVGACSSNGVQRGVLDHPRANTSVQERKAPEQRRRGGALPGGNKPIRSNTKTNKKNAQNNRGRHKQHPPKAKSHTQHPQDKHGKTPKPNHNQRTRHRQSRPINRADRLTRAPTHKPETSKT